MDKKELSQQMLKLLNEFQKADEPARKKLGRVIAAFFQKNETIDNRNVALTDPELQYIGFVAELDDYQKETFSEDDLAVAISILQKIVKRK